MEFTRDTTKVAGTDLTYPFWIQAYLPKDDDVERRFLGWVDGRLTAPADDQRGDGGVFRFHPDSYGAERGMTQETFDEACLRDRDVQVESGVLKVIGEDGRMSPSVGVITCGRCVINDYVTSPIMVV